MKRLLSLLALPLAAACGGTPDERPAPNHFDDTKPLYAIVSIFNTGDGTQSYLSLTDDLTKSQTIGIDHSMEIAGSGIGVSAPVSGQLFVSSQSGATITKYTLDENDALVQGDVLSFENLGVKKISSYSSQFFFASAEKAYYFDDTNYQLVVWNPNTLEIVAGKSKDLTSELHYKVGDETFPFTYSQTPPVRYGKDIIFAGGWFSADRLSIPARTALVVVDTETDAVTVKVDERCGWARDGVLNEEDGLIYYASESYAGGAHFISPDKSTPCLIRFDPESKTFDDFYKTLDEVIDPANAGDIGGMLMAGPKGKAYLRVMDKAAARAVNPAAPIQAATGSWWHLWEVTLGDEPTARAVEREDLVPVNGRSVLQQAGDVLIAPEYVEGKTRLRILDDGLGDAQTVVEGQVRSVARLR